MVQALQRWNVAQLNTLRRLALTLLFRLAPLAAPQFRALGGADTLLRAVHAAPAPLQREAAMRVLRNLLHAHANLRPWLGTCGAIVVAKGCFADRSLPQDLRQEAVTFLHSLCLDCEQNLDRFEEERVIALLVDEIGARRGVEPLTPCYFTIELAALVWTAALRRPAVLRAFLLADGARYTGWSSPR